MRVEIRTTPDLGEMQRRVAGFPERMMKALVPVIDKQHELTIGHIQASRLSQPGPESLGVRTGRLRRSITAAAARLVNPLTIYSGLGSNVRYLGVHEYGFSGTVTVKAHERRFASVAGGQFAGARRSISLREAASLRRTKKKKEAVGFHEGVSQVKEHTRKMEFPARAPVRRGIEDRLPAYKEAMVATIQEEWGRLQQ